MFMLNNRLFALLGGNIVLQEDEEKMEKQKQYVTTSN